MTASLKMCYTRESLVDKIHFPLQSGISLNVVVVSEETGAIGYFKNGERVPFSSYKELSEMLIKDMN